MPEIAHNTDALIVVATALTHTTDSRLDPYFLRINHRTNAVLARNYTKVHTIDTFLGRLQWHDTDSLLLDSSSVEHFTDSHLIAGIRHTTDALVVISTDLTHTIDSYLSTLIPVAVYYLKNHRTNALLATVSTRTHTMDTYLGAMGGFAGHLVDSYLLKPTTIAHTVSDYLASPVASTLTHDTDAAVVTFATLSHDTDAIAIKLYKRIKIHRTDARLVVTSEINHATDAVLSRGALHTTDSLIVSLTSFGHFTDSYLIAVEFGDGGAEGGGEVVETISWAASGGAEIGGSFDGSTSFEVSKEFSYNAGECIPYWWQVNGICQQFDCLVWGGTTWNPILSSKTVLKDCERSFQITIMACNLQELCLKLQEREFQFTIDKIYKWTRPAMVSDAYLESCGTFIQVYPGFDLADVPAECLEYLITGAVDETWGAEVTAEFVCTVVGSGGLLFRGCDLIPGDYSEVEYSDAFDGSSETAICLYPNISKMVGEGGLNLGLTIGTYLGDFEVSCGMSSELLATEYVFTEELPGGLAASQDEVAEACNCGPYPLILQITHNLSKADKLKYFLLRNNLSLPSTIPFEYNVKTFSWQASYHFKGYGEDGSSFENWDLLFEWACTDEVGGMITDQIWKFSMYIKQRKLSTGRDFDTRVLLAFSPPTVCRPSYGLRYSFELDTEAKTVYSNSEQLDINVDLNTCFDNMGLFKGDEWLRSPTLLISVYQEGVPPTWRTMNLDFMVQDL